MLTRVVAFLALFALLSSVCLGSQDQNYGLGGSSSGRVSSVAAETDNAFAALYNPALIPAQSAGQFGFSTGLTGASHSTLSGVLVDSPQYRTERGLERRQDFRLPNHAVTSWAAGLTLPFSLPTIFSRRAGLGLTASGPYQKLRSFNALTPYDFSSLRYGTSDSQFKGTISMGLELWPERFYAGAGLSLFLTSAGAADGTVLTENPTGRLALDIGFNTAVVAGLLARFEPTRIALVFREAINPVFEQRLDGKLEFAGTETFRQPFILRSSLYFEPRMVELEVQHDFGMLKVSSGISYQAWSQYKPSYILLEAQHADGRNRTTREPSLSMRDTVSPRLSVEAPLIGDLVGSAGYRYRPTPVTNLAGEANILDTGAHIAGASLKYHFGAGEWIPTAMDVGMYGQYHFFERRQVTKESGDFIGAPGYEYTGNAYTYGLFVQADL